MAPTKAKDTFAFLVNHVVLPPKLPKGQEVEDDEREEGELLILQTIRKSAESLQYNLNNETKAAWVPVLSLLHNMENLVESNSGNNDLAEVLANMKIYDAITVHAEAQNAGLLFFRPDEDQVIVHAFEASAHNSAVTRTKDRLIWDFPGRSVTFASKLLKDQRFVCDLDIMISKMCQEALILSMPTTKKGRSDVPEARDTIHPGLVTEGFMTMLEALGAPCKSPTVRKRIRDDVNWNNANIPWRRSPLWLVIRASIQLLLSHQFPGSAGRYQYKNLMALMMANVCREALHHKVNTDIQKIVVTKAARRLSKLGNEAMSYVQQEVQSAVQDVHKHLEDWWAERRRKDIKNIPRLRNEAVESDCNLTLAVSGDYLRKALANIEAPSDYRRASFISREWLTFTEDGLPRIRAANTPFHQILSLTDFEQWVMHKLYHWMEVGKKTDKDCTSLLSIGCAYLGIARDIYKDNSQAMSVMLLVLLEIWTVLDLICLDLYPLLRDYSPEIPYQIGNSLLLPHHDQLSTLKRIENHLLKRHQEARSRCPGIFTHGQIESFGVRFFNQSGEHQAMQSVIELDATRRREKKKAEWKRKSDKYSSLMQRYHTLPHEYTINRWGDSVHGSCSKCTAKSQAKNLSIRPDEWPLPTNKAEMKAAIFELACPSGFCAWRDATWMIVQDLGRCIEPDKAKSEMQILTYDLLRPYAKNSGQRISLGSTTKSFLRAHYNHLSFPLSESSVCVNNGLTWEQIDGEKTCWTNYQSATPTFHHHCISPLPQGPYSELQDFVNTSSLPPNESLARQQQCHSELSPHEFLAFASLRSGERIQWLNILRELGSADLTINAEEVFVLFRQAALQAGISTCGDVLREAHAHMHDEAFKEKLLDLLEIQLNSITSNWKEQLRLATIVVLALRTLSLSTEEEIITRVVGLVRQVRMTALAWCRKITKRLPDYHSDAESKRLRRTILTSALVCRMTFDCQLSQVHLVLEHENDLADYVESSIHLFDNTPVNLSELPLNTQITLLMCRKVSRMVEDRLNDLTAHFSRGINIGIERACGLTGIIGEWRAIDGYRGWLSCFVKTGSGGPPQKIDYDLLMGELLINGCRIGRLPSAFTSSPIYERTFGCRFLNVASSHLPGFQYRTVGKLENHEIYLGMNGNELLIQAKVGRRRLRLIPHGVLDADLPKSLTEDFIHWMNLETGTITFCPLNNPWKAVPGIILQFSPNGVSRLELGQKRLFDREGALAKRITGILEVLETPSRIVITAESHHNTVEAEIPRFRLKFIVNCNGYLESKELGTIVDEDQDIGCLYGLRHKLALKSANWQGGLHGRSVIIPYGKVQVFSCGENNNIAIQTGEEKKLRFMNYQLDQTLSRLRTQSGNAEKLYLAHLHAVTSSVMPDPLTGHTGVEEALRILSEQSLKTSSPPDHETVMLLNQIAALTPERFYYPEKSELTQRVEWNSSLSQLTQHERFHTLAQDIYQHAMGFLTFYEKPATSLKFRSSGDRELLDKATKRNAGIRNPALVTKERCDSVYNSRDTDTESSRARRVFEMAAATRKWPGQIGVVPDLVASIRNWNEVVGYGQKFDVWGTPCNDTAELKLGHNWGSLYDLCHDCHYEKDVYKLMFLFCTIAFAQIDSVEVLRTLLGIASSGCLRNVLPEEKSYNLSLGERPSSSDIRYEVNKCCYGCSRNLNENSDQWTKRYRHFEDEKANQVDRVVDHMSSQWPCDRPNLNTLYDISHIKEPEAEAACASLFTRWNKNRKFLEHISEVHLSLDIIRTGYAMEVRHSPPVCLSPIMGLETHTAIPSLSDLFSERSPPELPDLPLSLQIKRPRRSGKLLQNGNELRRILNSVRLCEDFTCQNYARDMFSSLEAFDSTEVSTMPEKITVTAQQLEKYSFNVAMYTQEALASIAKALEPETVRDRALHGAGLWPRTIAASLLSSLSAKKLQEVPEKWKNTLLTVGKAISMLQRSTRLLKFFHRKDIVAFYKDAEEPGHQSWNPQEFPDWLLLEVENDLTIRNTQAVVARQMIMPECGSNSVLQLNMGEGKSSVIVPMVMTAIADKTRIARLVVLKPLLRQTENLLSQRLGGIVNRRIYHIPFSRKTKIDEGQITLLRGIFEQCMAEQGILVTLPEHMMSFRLMGRERLRAQPAIGASIIRLDGWIEKHCRDVLDESDEILDPRFQLVYSMGTQCMIDGQPDRWTLVQAVLLLLFRIAQQLHQTGDRRLEVELKGRSFPFIAFLDHSVGPDLMDLLVQSIGQGNLVGVSLTHCSRRLRQDVLEFIRNRSVPDEVFSRIDNHFRDTELWTKLHLLRGLIAHDILLFTFQKKRWLVNYGLDPSRCKMAVPYRAKGVPSPSAEFGHPDVAIVLTCLSYYYAGLTTQELDHIFSLLMKESDSSSEYNKWVQDCPGLQIRNIHGVNLEDSNTKKEVFTHIRYSKSAIDFYLSMAVFPHEGKEFPHKLSSSAWDIPNQDTKNVTAGFSGTNDNKFLFPKSIRQHDLESLSHTNAMVANLLLQEENRRYIKMADKKGKKLEIGGLLEVISRKENSVDVLIDVGAQVLDSQNHEVAAEWLKHSPQANAAVFFDDKDELMVADRDGYVERLSSSPFHQQLDGCLIYLDEVHTRGVDLSMPTHARAAVTLGPRTVKDRLVQACMRMRKLGCHQTLIFLAPPEVHEEILRITGKIPSDSLSSVDVLHWSFVQTCQATDGLKPLWIMQGLEHARRKRLCSQYLTDNDELLVDHNQRKSFCSGLEEPEGKLLVDMYGAGSQESGFRACITDHESRKDPIVQDLLSEWELFKDSKNGDWALREEQEREIAHEVEQEREHQRPPPAKALLHELHPDVRYFVQTGNFRNRGQEGSACYQAFNSLQQTSARSYLPSMPISRDLLATKDFLRTVDHLKESKLDDFMRPVRWVLSSISTQCLLIISPFEANALLKEIWSSSKVVLHLYSPKISTTMENFSGLDFHTITGFKQPKASNYVVGFFYTTTSKNYLSNLLLITQLELFSGCLFFDDYAAYKRACHFLGILTAKQDSGDIQILSDGFADKAARTELSWPLDSPFDQSPLPFFRALVRIRRKGYLYNGTHLGHLLNGHPLSKESFY